MDTNFLSSAGTASLQASSQSPQIAGRPSSNAARSSGVQQGTAQQVLESDTGVPLSSTPLPSVSLSGPTTSTTASTTTTASTHHVNPVFVGLITLVFVIAVISFVIISKDAKKTT